MFGRLAKWLLRNERGNTTMLVGLALFPMIGAIGLGVDAAQWVLWKRQIHTAADLGALAGARALADNQELKVAVRRSLAHNDLNAFTIDAIENAPVAGKFAGSNAHVKVTLSTQRSLPFSSLFLANPPKITVSAVAENSSEVPNCIIALDTTDTALSITGSSSIDMNCGLSSNSNLDATSSDYINAGALSAVGIVDASGGVTSDTKINDGIAAESDPLSGLAVPSDVATQCASAVWHTTRSRRVETLGEGCYAGITVQGQLTLTPGTYIIDGGGISVGANGVLLAENVTIIFTNSDPTSTDIGKFTAQGDSVVNLTASNSGDYEGILMFQDRRAVPSNASNFYITGNSGTDNAGNAILSQYQGTIYTPSTYTLFNGNSSIQTPCMQVVAQKVEFLGNTTVKNECPPGSGASAYGGGGTIRLVG